MVERADIDSLLQNGYWPTNTSTRTNFNLPTATTNYSYNDRVVPRITFGIQYGARLRRNYPPPPIVEDEVASLAKEYGSAVSKYDDEQPKNRGEADQHPVLLEVHEHNPERRFVLVSNQSDSSDEFVDGDWKSEKRAKRREDTSRETRDEPNSYEANTGRKYLVVAPDEEATQRKNQCQRRESHGHQSRPLVEKRRSRRKGLPAIVTDFNHQVRSDGRRDINRAISATETEQAAEGYFSPQHESRNPGVESLLSPDVIKHSTKGRDRAYWDYSGASTPQDGHRNRSTCDQDTQHGRSHPNPRKSDEYEPRRLATIPTLIKRHSAFEVPRHAPQKPKDGHRNGRQYTAAPSARLDRKNSSPPPVVPEWESLRPRSSSFRSKHESSRDDRYSSEEEKQRGNDGRRRRKSFVHDERGYLATPTESGPNGGRRSKVSLPLASPRMSQAELIEGGPSPSPRSATFPTSKESSACRHVTEAEALQRPLSRASTARSSANNSSASIVVPIVAAAAAAALNTSDSASPVDRRKDAVPLPPKRRSQGDSRSDSRSSSSSPSSSPPREGWQPPKFDPVKNGSPLDMPIISYRRFSEDVSKGEIPDLPDCPRTIPESGHFDWLTLPRCNNFNICPSCYQFAFQDTEYKHLLRPVPFRQDMPLKCDLGTSQFYHIAWVLTRTYNLPDLRLFQGITDVDASTLQSCTGPEESVRLWFTLKDPASQRAVRNFRLCQKCAKTIEVLLPSLSGIFVPMDIPAEPRRGICDMHQEYYYGGVRDKFIDYFSVMEVISDEARESQSAPNVRKLAARIQAHSELPECTHGRPLQDAKWFTMRSIPGMTVCKTCFDEVVWPVLESEDSSVAGDFFQRPQRLQHHAACQLYSQRMRDAFQKAVRRNRIDYLKEKFEERRAREQIYYSKLAGLDRHALGSEWADVEIQRLRKEWQRWE